MQPNEQKIQQILSMGEEDFARVVYTVVLSATADKQKAGMAMAMAPMIRDKIKTANSEEIRTVLALLGEEKLQAILRSLES